MELALFNSSGKADRSMGMFIDWARPFVASVQHSIDQRLPRCAPVNAEGVAEGLSGKLSECLAERGCECLQGLPYNVVCGCEGTDNAVCGCECLQRLPHSAVCGCEGTLTVLCAALQPLPLTCN